MSRMQKFKEQQKKLSRFQALKSIFSSLLLTTTAVIIAVIVIPASPKAEIQSVNAFTDAITYTVNVTDSDNAIIDGTLELVLENQFDTYSNNASTGVNSGMFQFLEPDTKYTLKVMADKGFGLEVLVSQTVKTAPNPGGAITGISLISDLDQWMLEYQLDYYISDPFDDYQQVQLTYGIKYSYEEEYGNFQTILLDTVNLQTILGSISNENVAVILKLEAIDQNLDTILLDEVEFHTPYQVYASIYPMQITTNSVALSIWLEASDIEDAVIELTLMEGYYVVDTITYVPVSYEDTYQQFSEEPTVLFEHLKANTTYHIEALVRYSDPYTLEEVTSTLESTEFTTMPKFDMQYTIEDMGEYYIVTIVVDDPDHAVQSANYVIYQDIDGFETIFAQETFYFDFVGEEKTVSFEIYKPTDDFTKIVIVVRNTTIYTNYVVVDTITE
ncbi:MAG: hypothetical protein JXB08_04900 [Bacilli bacterium]|nr:hypothetical protein [Bacilli bacterium]MBN2877482.1 hypothetical protein [Bacilli bacterium]